MEEWIVRTLIPFRNNSTKGWWATVGRVTEFVLVHGAQPEGRKVILRHRHGEWLVSLSFWRVETNPVSSML